METPSPYTEFGLKGIGEGGAIGPPAAIANAVNDALRPLGVEIGESPITPRRLLAAIAAAGPCSAPMKAVAFDYERPARSRPQRSACSRRAGGVKMLAGGQSLGPDAQFAPGAARSAGGCRRLIRDCTRVRTTRMAPSCIGACVTHAADRGRPDARPDRRLPARASPRGIAYRAVRNRGDDRRQPRPCRPGGRLALGTDRDRRQRSSPARRGRKASRDRGLCPRCIRRRHLARSRS